MRCEGVDCTEFQECRGRRETYKVDTHFLTVRAGEAFTFTLGQLKLEHGGRFKQLSLSARVLARPGELLRRGVVVDGEGSGGATLQHAVPATFHAREQLLEHAGRNFTHAAASPDGGFFEGTGNISDLALLLRDLRVAAPFDAGTSRSTRQFLLRIQLRVVAEDGNHFTRSRPNPEGTTDCREGCRCVGGFAGAACDVLGRPLDIWISVEPQASGRRVQPELRAAAGRRPTLNRDGHGTHVATSIVGRTDDRESGGGSAVRRFDGMAREARLAFVDIGASGKAYLTPPESLGEPLMGRAYREAGARVMLHPWTCEDVSWWRRQDQPLDPEQVHPPPPYSKSTLEAESLRSLKVDSWV